MTENTTPVALLSLAKREVEGLQLPDWYRTLRSNVEQNCLTPSRSLRMLLDADNWLVARPRIKLVTKRNQLGNLKTTWEPVVERWPPSSGATLELSHILLNLFEYGQNELMWIKEPWIGITQDEAVTRAANMLTRALLLHHSWLARPAGARPPRAGRRCR